MERSERSERVRVRLLRELFFGEGDAELVPGRATLFGERCQRVEVEVVELRGVQSEHLACVVFAHVVERVSEREAGVRVGPFVVGIVAAP